MLLPGLLLVFQRAFELLLLLLLRRLLLLLLLRLLLLLLLLCVSRCLIFVFMASGIFWERGTDRGRGPKGLRSPLAFSFLRGALLPLIA